MIYTIGHKENYMMAIAENGEIYKTGKGLVPDDPSYIGGYAFETAEDAQRRIDEAYPENGFSVFGLDVTWGVDTYPNPEGGWWHNLIPDAKIIVLGGSDGTME